MGTKAKAKVNSRWFQDRLADKNMSQRGFARLIKMDPAALSYAIQGKRGWRHDELVAFATIVGVPFDEAAMQAGLQMPATNSKGMCNVVGQADTTGAVAFGGALPAPRRVPLPPEAPEATAAIRFKTPNTPAEMMDGWLVYFSEDVKRVPPEAVGRLCVAWLPGQAIVGTLRRGYVRGTHNLQPWTPGGVLLENVQLERAAPVLWIRTSA